jgi:acylphosphatase
VGTETTLEKAFRIQGRVQGVGFRWWTRSQAQSLGLVGSVRNCADGSVEVQARGPADAIAQLESLLRDGPPGAYVTSLEELPTKQMPQDAFRILR